MIMTLKKNLLISLLFAIFITQGYAQDRALLVGIDDYWYLGALKGSTQDVKDMQQFLQFVWHYRSDQVRTLIDAQATRENILEAFDNWLIKDSRPGDRVLFYFSGHGYYIPDDNGDESDGYDETLCPVNTRGMRTMIRDDEINARLQRLRGRKVTVIIDAGHSGSMTEDLGLFDPSIKVPVFEIPMKPLKRRLPPNNIEQDGFIDFQKNVIAYSAVAPNQVALVDTIAKSYRGVFTRNFIMGTQEVRADSNSDGKVTHNELLEYMRRESQSYCRENPLQCKAGELTPQLEALPEILSRDALTGIAYKTYNTAAGATSLFAHDNEADLQIKILPQRSRFKIGEMIKIQISSERDGYLLLFDISSKGALTCLFPNQYSQLKDEYGYHLKAGQILTISSSLDGFNDMAETPLGKGLLVALLVEDKVLKRHELPLRALEPVPAKQALIVLQQLRQQLNQTLRQENAANRPVRWGAAVFEYELISAKRVIWENLEHLYHPNSGVFTKIRKP
jgi:hypothetical protein